jgi:hypothetical protein
MLYGNESCATDWCTGAGRPILTESQLAALEKAKVDEAAHASSTARHEDDGKCYDERELDPRQQNDACIINPASP